MPTCASKRKRKKIETLFAHLKRISDCEDYAAPTTSSSSPLPPGTSGNWRSSFHNGSHAHLSGTDDPPPRTSALAIKGPDADSSRWPSSSTDRPPIGQGSRAGAPLSGSPPRLGSRTLI